MTFKFRNNENCCLDVWHYDKEKAMGITVIDVATGEKLETLTCLDKNADYEEGLITVFDEIVDEDEMGDCKTGTEILQELGVIQYIWDKYILEIAEEFPVSVAVCSINLNILAEYSKDWEYWEYEPEE